MAWGVVFEGGVGALGVVVFDVSGDRRACGGEVVKAVRPDAFLFEGADEALGKRGRRAKINTDKEEIRQTVK